MMNDERWTMKMNDEDEWWMMNDEWWTMNNERLMMNDEWWCYHRYLAIDDIIFILLIAQLTMIFNPLTLHLLFLEMRQQRHKSWWLRWLMIDDWLMMNDDGWMMMDDGDVWSSSHNMMMMDTLNRHKTYKRLNRHNRHKSLYRCFMNDFRSCFSRKSYILHIFYRCAYKILKNKNFMF